MLMLIVQEALYLNKNPLNFPKFIRKLFKKYIFQRTKTSFY